MGRTKSFANQAIRIRLARYGCANRPFYHIVAAKAYRARDNKPLEQIGTYDPMPNDHNEKLVAINFEKLQNWFNRGARLAKPVETLLGLSGFFPVHPMCMVQAKRNLQKREQQQAQLVQEELAEGTAV